MLSLKPILLCGLFHSFALAVSASISATRTSFSPSTAPFSYTVVILLANSEVDTVPISSHTASASDSPFVSFEPSTLPYPPPLSTSSLSFVSRVRDSSFTTSWSRSFLSTKPLSTVSGFTTAPSTPFPKETSLSTVSLLIPTLVFQSKPVSSVADTNTPPSPPLPKESVVSSVSLLIPTASTSRLLSPFTEVPSASSTSVSVSAYADSTTVLMSSSTSSVSDSSRSPLSSLLQTYTLPEISNSPSSSPTTTGGSTLGIDPVLLLYIVIPPCCLLVLVVLGFGLFLCIRRIMRLRRLHSHLLPLRDMEGSEDSDDDGDLDNDASFTLTSSEHNKPVLRFHE